MSLYSLSRTQMRSPHWLDIAFAEMGVSAYPAGSSNPRVTEYHEGTNIAGYDDKASWCSSFINWFLSKAGISGTGSALARSWLEWGTLIEEPVIGCIAVLWRERPPVGVVMSPSTSAKTNSSSICSVATSWSKCGSTSTRRPWFLVTGGQAAITP